MCVCVCVCIFRVQDSVALKIYVKKDDTHAKWSSQFRRKYAKIKYVLGYHHTKFHDSSRRLYLMESAKMLGLLSIFKFPMYFAFISNILFYFAESLGGKKKKSEFELTFSFERRVISRFK